MANVAPGIITNGLGGNHSNMIIGVFNLGFISIEIIEEKPTLRPGGAGLATDKTFPDRTEPWDEDAPRAIIIRIKIKDKTTEKIYHVSAKRAKFIITVTNFISKTHDRIKVTINNLKHRAKRFFVKFRNDEK